MVLKSKAFVQHVSMLWKCLHLMMTCSLVSGLADAKFFLIWVSIVGAWGIVIQGSRLGSWDDQSLGLESCVGKLVWVVADCS